MKKGKAAAGPASSAKVNQGDELMREGEKCARTSLFKWSPDWDGAFMAYEKAALCYKTAKALDKCKEAHLKAADAQSKCNLIHGAAKNWEAAGHCAREQKQSEEAVRHFQTAASLYSENGSLEKAAEVLSQAARSLEDLNPDAAANLLLEAVDLLENDSKRGAEDAFKKAITFLIRHQRIDRAIEVVGKEIEFFRRNMDKSSSAHELHRSFLTLVILHLHRNDYVAADKTYNEALSNEGFALANEGRAAADLLDAFEKNDSAALQSCLSRQVFTFLDGAVIRLARGLRVNDSVQAPSSSSSSSGRRAEIEVHDTATPSPNQDSHNENQEEESPRAIARDDEEEEEDSILL